MKTEAQEETDRLDAAYFEQLDLCPLPEPAEIDVVKRTESLLGSFSLDLPRGLTSEAIQRVIQACPHPERGTLQVLLGLGGNVHWYTSKILEWDKPERLKAEAERDIFNLGALSRTLYRRTVEGRQLKWHINHDTNAEDVLTETRSLPPRISKILSFEV